MSETPREGEKRPREISALTTRSRTRRFTLTHPTVSPKAKEPLRKTQTYYKWTPEEKQELRVYVESRDKKINWQECANYINAIHCQKRAAKTYQQMYKRSFAIPRKPPGKMIHSLVQTDISFNPRAVVSWKIHSESEVVSLNASVVESDEDASRLEKQTINDNVESMLENYLGVTDFKGADVPSPKRPSLRELLLSSPIISTRTAKVDARDSPVQSIPVIARSIQPKSAAASLLSNALTQKNCRL